MKFPEPPPLTPMGSRYLKLQPGESVIVVFRGEPETYYRVYEDGKYRTVPSTDANGTFRFAINAIVEEGGQLVAKIFEGNWHDFKSLRELHSQFDLEQTYIKISQTGERQSKRISFSPIVKAKPNLEKLLQIELKEIKRTVDGDDNVPF